MGHLLHLLLWFLALGVGHNKAASIPKCCKEKTVGGVAYMLLEETNTMKYGCKNNCVYEKKDSPGSRFCFKKGYLEVVCDVEETGVEGIVVTGGESESSTEIFIPKTGKSCSLAPLPVASRFHTSNTINNTPVLCGGAALSSCWQFTPASTDGVWTNYSSTKYFRYTHIGWASGSGLVLLGGSLNGTEAIAEVVSPEGNLVEEFDLLDTSMYTCGIPDIDTIIVTGGQFTEKKVSRYSLQGHVEYLPELSQGRAAHGCGSYLNSENVLVLLVAGGFGGGEVRSSTETFTFGSTSWTIAQPLPWAMHSMGYVSQPNSIIFLGGRGASKQARDEVLTFDGTSWVQTGKLLSGRDYAYATKMTIDIAGCNCCS